MKIFRQNTVLKVLSLNSISVVISFLLGVFSSKLVSVFLGSSGMALMGSFRNFSAMSKSMANLGISNSIIKLFVENKEDQKELSIIYSTFFWLFLSISVFLAILILLFADTISGFIFFENSFVIPIRFLGLLLPLMVINTFWIAIYNGMEHFKRIVFIQIISNIIVFCITVYLIWQHNITGGLFAVALGEVIMVLITFIFVKKDRQYFQFDLQRIVSKKYVEVIKRFSVMALLSAIIAPLTLLLIRNYIVENDSVNEAGIWDAVNRLSGFYMVFFSSGLSLYYMPKLASLNTEQEFKTELKSYFKVFVPLFLLLVIGVYFLKGIILKIAFTEEFMPVQDIVIWQLLGDFVRIMTLAFGFQILIKTMMKRYFVIEIVFNLSYLFLSFYLVRKLASEGAVLAYFIANLLSLAMVLLMFRKLFVKTN